MKMRFLLLVALFFRMVLFAQDSPKTYSLRQCIDYALINNTEIKNSTIDEYIAKSKVDEYKGTGLPQISGSAGVQSAKPLRNMYLQNNPGPFFDSRAPAGAVMVAPNFFQLPNTIDASLTLTQLIFSSSFFVGLKAAKTYKELATTSKEVSKISITESVTKAYYMALINQERKNLFDINISRVDSLLKQTRALNKSGFAEKLDVDRIEVTYNNLLTEKRNFENLLVLSGLLLKYQMNLPVNEELVLSDKIENLTVDTNLLSGKADYNNRPEYRLLKKQQQLESLNHKNNIYSLLPNLAFSANVGYFTQSPDYNFKYPFSRYGTYTLGLNMPIFTGFTRLKKIQQSKLALSKSDNNLLQFERTVDFQARSSEINYKNSIQSLQSQQRNMDLAKEVARVTRIKYTSGVGSNIEVITAESSLKEAQVNYYNALYDALVQKVDFDKSLGNLK